MPLSPGELDLVERWFVRKGVPHAIADYSAREDVLTRAAPFLTLVFFAEVFFGTFSDRLAGWAQAAGLAGGLMVLLAIGVLVNRVRGRRPFRPPDDIGSVELAVFVLAPALLPLLFANERLARVLIVVVGNLLILGLVYLAVSYGAIGLIRVGLGQAVRQVTHVFGLAGRSLPLLLLFTAFVFLNAEMWQVAHDFVPAYYFIVVGGIVVLAVAFLAIRAPTEVESLARFDDWDTVDHLCRATEAPIVAFDDRPDRPAPAQLSRDERINLGLFLLAAQLVQLFLIAGVIAAFYIGFGVLAVREDTILQWTTTETSETLDTIVSGGFLGARWVLTWEHLAVAGFISAFSLLQLAVASVTDASYREELGDGVRDDARSILAVRATYVAAMEARDKPGRLGA
ncbi:MAG: hypothetical protein GY929_23640 [Actinomycetia bacterium]|nr:hypothetical protein [Actinomycetes bacterium]